MLARECFKAVMTPTTNPLTMRNIFIGKLQRRCVECPFENDSAGLAMDLRIKQNNNKTKMNLLYERFKLNLGPTN